MPAVLLAKFVLQLANIEQQLVVLRHDLLQLAAQARLEVLIDRRLREDRTGHRRS